MNQLTRQKRRAFSIIEFFAVSTIVGIIAAIVVPRVVGADKLAKEKNRDHSEDGSVEKACAHGLWPTVRPSPETGFARRVRSCPLRGAP